MIKTLLHTRFQERLNIRIQFLPTLEDQLLWILSGSKPVRLTDSFPPSHGMIYHF